MRSSAKPAPTVRTGWLPTFLIAFALVVAAVLVLRGVLNVMRAGPSVQTGMFTVFRILAVVSEGMVLLGGLALALRPSLLTFQRAGSMWPLRLAGLAILVLGALGTLTFWVYYIGVGHSLLALLFNLGPLLLVPAYLLLLGLTLRSNPA